MHIQRLGAEVDVQKAHLSCERATQMKGTHIGTQKIRVDVKISHGKFGRAAQMRELHNRRSEKFRKRANFAPEMHAGNSDERNARTGARISCERENLAPEMCVENSGEEIARLSAEGLPPLCGKLTGDERGRLR